MSRARVTMDSDIVEAAKALLDEGESLQQFVDLEMRRALVRRHAKAEFLRRGMAAGHLARQSGQYRDSESVLAELEAILRSKEAPQGPL